MPQKILIIGANADNALLIARLKEEHGNDIVFFTPEEAKAQGLGMEDFANIPTFKITAPPLTEYRHEVELSGKEKRRLRRKNRNQT